VTELSCNDQWQNLTALPIYSFIQRNADLLLAMGWQGYQAHGPGAILIDADRDLSPTHSGRAASRRACT
jgi:hypothetical protein